MAASKPIQVHLHSWVVFLEAIPDSWLVSRARSCSHTHRSVKPGSDEDKSREWTVKLSLFFGVKLFCSLLVTSRRVWICSIFHGNRREQNLLLSFEAECDADQTFIRFVNQGFELSLSRTAYANLLARIDILAYPLIESVLPSPLARKRFTNSGDFTVYWISGLHCRFP